MDDSYETSNGLSVGIDDRYGDADGDGFPNLAEFLKNTDADDDTDVPTADFVVGPSQTYTTISSAISALTADDQIIVVKPGTYAETLSNTSRKVFIISESVDPNETILAPTSGNAINATKDLYVRGITMESSGPYGYGLNLTGTGNYGVVQCILNGHFYGIYSKPSGSSSHNYIDLIGTVMKDGGSTGIYAQWYKCTVRLIHSTISGYYSYAIYSNTFSGHSCSYTFTNSIAYNDGKQGEVLQNFLQKR